MHMCKNLLSGFKHPYKKQDTENPYAKRSSQDIRMYKCNICRYFLKA